MAAEIAVPRRQRRQHVADGPTVGLDNILLARYTPAAASESGFGGPCPQFSLVESRAILAQTPAGGVARRAFGDRHDNVHEIRPRILQVGL